MSGLGLRYCPNHPAVPLVLVSTGSGTYWRCEHASGCAHTENAESRRRTPRRVVAVNGKLLPGGRSATTGRVHTSGGSSVERDAIAHQEHVDREAHR